MTDTKRIERAFIAARKWGEAAFLLDRRDALATPGQNLVRIALMADIPDETVVRRVVQIVQRDREFDHAEARAEMSARACDRFDQVFAQLARDFAELGFIELAQVGRGVDTGKARIALGVDHVDLTGCRWIAIFRQRSSRAARMEWASQPISPTHAAESGPRLGDLQAVCAALHGVLLKRCLIA